MPREGLQGSPERELRGSWGGVRAGVELLREEVGRQGAEAEPRYLLPSLSPTICVIWWSWLC